MKTRISRCVFAAAILAAASTALPAYASGVFSSSSYSATTTFQDHDPSTTMTLAWDGANYYTSSGGSASSPYAKYDASGNFIASTSPTPGIDFRSVFTDSSNDLLARGFNSRTIYQQTSFGHFSALTQLNGGNLDAQSAVVMNGAGTEYLAEINGTVSRWNLAGNYLGSFSLAGFSALGYPQDRGLAVAGNDLLTYYNGTVTAWDMSGHNLGSATLLGAGTSFDSYFSFSYAHDKFWVVDQAGRTWRGYDLGLASANVPEPGSLALLALGLVCLGAKRRNRV